jgi:hypothetical protein
VTEAPTTQTPHFGGLEDAAVRYAQAKAALDGHQGPMRGDIYEGLIAAWRAALLDLDAAAIRAARQKGKGHDEPTGAALAAGADGADAGTADPGGAA